MSKIRSEQIDQFARTGPYSTPLKKCPYCEHPMHADWVDIGVGMQQCGPYHCFGCGASEIGPEFQKEKDAGSLTEEEIRTGFYRGRISPHANQIDGVPVDHKTADAVYRAEHFAKHGNPYNAPVYRFNDRDEEPAF